MSLALCDRFVEGIHNVIFFLPHSFCVDWQPLDPLRRFDFLFEYELKGLLHRNFMPQGLSDILFTTFSSKCLSLLTYPWFAQCLISLVSMPPPFIFQQSTEWLVSVLLAPYLLCVRTSRWAQSLKSTFLYLLI